MTTQILSFIFYRGLFEGKTLKSQLLKKLSIEFYETQDLSSTHGKPKLMFYDYSWNFFFLQPIAEGNCDRVEIKARRILVVFFCKPRCTELTFTMFVFLNSKPIFAVVLHLVTLLS